jgi:hypothetical protein
MDTNEKGDIACQKVILRALEKGIGVSRPISDASRYDLILDKNGKLYRTQIKYCDGERSNAQGSIAIRLQADNKKPIEKGGRRWTYSVDEIDVVIAYFPRYDKFCWFEASMIADKTAITVRFEKPANGQVKGLHLAEEYEW